MQLTTFAIPRTEMHHNEKRGVKAIVALRVRAPFCTETKTKLTPQLTPAK
jgi:hypothetical protein